MPVEQTPTQRESRQQYLYHSSSAYLYHFRRNRRPAEITCHRNAVTAIGDRKLAAEAFNANMFPKLSTEKVIPNGVAADATAQR
jgi:hypothetical protein